MNVLFYTSLPAISTGGPVRWTRRLIGTLQEMGHHVHVFTWGQLRPEQPAWGSEMTCVPLNPRVARVPLLGFWYEILAPARALRRVLARRGIDVIHTLGIYETAGATLARGSGPAALVVSIHGDFVTERAMWWKSRLRARLHLPLERAAFRGCQVVTTSSAWLARQLRPHLQGAPIVIIPNGIDLPAPGTVWPDRQALGLPEDKKIVLTLNNLTAAYRRQGLQLLIAAAPDIVAQVPDVQLVVVGGVDDPGRDRASLEWARSQTEGMPFLFTGYRQHSPHDMMVASDLYVHPSVLDNSPTAVLEAMTMAKPIVATEVGGIPELITDGQTGRLVPLEPAALAAAVVALLRNQDEASRLARNAYKTAASRFTWSRVGEQFGALYVDASKQRASQEGGKLGS